MADLQRKMEQMCTAVTKMEDDKAAEAKVCQVCVFLNSLI